MLLVVIATSSGDDLCSYLCCPDKIECVVGNGERERRGREESGEREDRE